jgi:DNA (cytosine-5)-methyltransferase 1
MHFMLIASRMAGPFAEQCRVASIVPFDDTATLIKRAMAERKPTAVELFCGVGGMSLGFQKAGFKLLAAIDNDKYNTEYHSLNFPSCRTLTDDLSKMTGRQIRKKAKLGNQKIDVVFGGPPCQGFSLIGRRNVEDSRNQLLYHFIRIVHQLKPDYFVMENVQGLTVGDARRMLEKFVAKAKRAGYHVICPIQVLDASDFGVPQRRNRVIVIGYRRGVAAPSYPTPSDEEKPTVRDAISDLPILNSVQQSYDTDVYVGELGTPSQFAKELRNRHRKAKKVALTGCLVTRHSSKTIARFMATVVGKTEPISRFHRLNPDGLAFTIRAGTGRDFGSHTAARPIHPDSPRCITVREAARLHSFPDWFQFHPTRWHGFRQIGNSVPPLFAKAVAGELARVIRRTSFRSRSTNGQTTK